MSGHSKWSTIKRKKGAADAKKGQLFTKLIKEITVAAKMGGGDPNANPRLRFALDNARVNSMPKDNMERAIKKGTGELEGVTYEELTYEGYGPAGVAILVESLTDNKNRTVSELRNLFSKRGGNLGENGCVAWMFKKKGCLTFGKKQVTEDQLMEVALDNGAEDIKGDDEHWEVLSDPNTFESLKKKLESAGLKPEHAELAMLPENTITLGLEDAEKTLKLMELLEDHEDVQKVYANFDIPPEVLSKISP